MQNAPIKPYILIVVLYFKRGVCLVSVLRTSSALDLSQQKLEHIFHMILALSTILIYAENQVTRML